MNIKNKSLESINIGNNLISQIPQICLLEYITKPLMRSAGSSCSDCGFKEKREIT